jgi:hypothetical protein
MNITIIIIDLPFLLLLLTLPLPLVFLTTTIIPNAYAYVQEQHQSFRCSSYPCYGSVDVSVGNVRKEMIYENQEPFTNKDLTLYKGDKYKYTVDITVTFRDPDGVQGSFVWSNMLIPNMTSLTDGSSYKGLVYEATVLTEKQIEPNTYSIKAELHFTIPYFVKVIRCSTSEDGTVTCWEEIELRYRQETRTITLDTFQVVRYEPKFHYLSHIDFKVEATIYKDVQVAIHYLGNGQSQEPNPNPNRRLVIDDWSSVLQLVHALHLTQNDASKDESYSYSKDNVKITVTKGTCKIINAKVIMEEQGLCNLLIQLEPSSQQSIIASDTKKYSQYFPFITVDFYSPKHWYPNDDGKVFTVKHLLFDHIISVGVASVTLNEVTVTPLEDKFKNALRQAYMNDTYDQNRKQIQQNDQQLADFVIDITYSLPTKGYLVSLIPTSYLQLQLPKDVEKEVYNTYLDNDNKSLLKLLTSHLFYSYRVCVEGSDGCKDVKLVNWLYINQVDKQQQSQQEQQSSQQSLSSSSPSSPSNTDVEQAFLKSILLLAGVYVLYLLLPKVIRLFTEMFS